MKASRPGRAVLAGFATLVLAACSGASMLGPSDPAAEVQPDLMVVEPQSVRPGETVSVSYPDERGRGVIYVLESQSGGEWNLEYHLISDWGGDRAPSYSEAGGSETTAVPDIGFAGPRPDVLLIPAEAEPGAYRVCTGNSRPNICALLTIDPEA